MVLDVDQVLTDLDGTPLPIDPRAAEEAGEDVKYWTVREACERALTVPVKGDENLDYGDKSHHYLLALEIHQSKGKFELDVKDAAMLQKRCGKLFPTIIAGQMVKVLNG
jgi:hypothetical protein